jgi:transcriptional regulator, hxlR family
MKSLGTNTIKTFWDHMLTKEELPECPVATTVSLIGSKWKLLIIRNLLERP